MRTLLYQALVAREPLIAILGSPDRLIEASALGNPQLSGYEGTPPRPFVTYRMHTAFPYRRKIGAREYAQVWANDEPGDYLRIDQILKEVRIAVEGIAPQGEFVGAEWIETGVDLRDDVMGTINRYIRFQFNSSLRESE